MQQVPKWLGAEFLGEDEMRKAKAQSLGVPFVVLTREDISPEALVLIPEPLSRAHQVVAYRHAGDAVEVAALDTAAIETIDFLRTDKKIKLRLTNQASITQALQIYQKHLKETFGSALQAGSAEALILHALQGRASDVHVEASPAGTRVRYRIQGVLHEAMRLSAEAGARLVASIKAAAKLFPTAVIQEGKFKIEKDNRIVLVSIANLPNVGGEKLTIHLAEEHAGHQGFTLSALGLHGLALERVHTMLHARGGLVLVAGKSGSGKTTTLYTLLDQLAGSHASIATIEETVEHTLPFATQTHTRPEVGLNMLAGLRAVLRSDPDIVMVGSIDSAETAELALEAASRGVLVLAALDARDASHAIEKMLSLVAAKPLAQHLRGVIGVHLAKKLVGEERLETKLSREEGALLEPYANFARVLAALKDEGAVGSHVAWKDIPFYKGEEGGGAIGLQEVLGVSSILKELLLQEADAEAIEQQARQEGMLTFVEEALFKAAEGLVSLEEVIEIASE